MPIKPQMKRNRDKLIGMEKTAQTSNVKRWAPRWTFPRKSLQQPHESLSPVLRQGQADRLTVRDDWGRSRNQPAFTQTQSSRCLPALPVHPGHCWEPLRERQWGWSEGNVSTRVTTEQAGTPWPENCLQFGIFKVYLKGDTASLKSVGFF